MAIFSLSYQKFSTTLLLLLLLLLLFYLFIYFFGCTVRHLGSHFPDQGLNPCPVQWKHGVLTTGPPGKSSTILFLRLA